MTIFITILAYKIFLIIYCYVPWTLPDKLRQGWKKKKKKKKKNEMNKIKNK